MPRQLTHDFGLDINEQHLNQMCVTNCGRRAYNLGTMCRECWEAKNLASYNQAINNAKANQERWCFTHYFSEPVWVCVQCEHRYTGTAPTSYSVERAPRPELCLCS